MLKALLIALPPLLLMSALVYLEWDHSARAKPTKSKTYGLGSSADWHAILRGR